MFNSPQNYSSPGKGLLYILAIINTFVFENPVLKFSLELIQWANFLESYTVLWRPKWHIVMLKDWAVVLSLTCSVNVMDKLRKHSMPQLSHMWNEMINKYLNRSTVRIKSGDVTKIAYPRRSSKGCNIHRVTMWLMIPLLSIYQGKQKHIHTKFVHKYSQRYYI